MPYLPVTVIELAVGSPRAKVQLKMACERAMSELLVELLIKPRGDKIRRCASGIAAVAGGLLGYLGHLAGVANMRHRI